MKKGQLQIHSQNILPIIKKWLYSEKDIFIRELVSNACDAITKRQVLQNKQTEPAKIDIFLDKEAKTLTVSDNGLGMDQEETEKYLAQLAFSGAEEFIKAYQTNDAFIGHFGLGFYSSYMVADLVQVETKSYKDRAESVLWQCDGSSEYTVDAGTRQEVGTSVILHINKENMEYLEETKILEVLKRYCQFLPYPVYFNSSCINDKAPLWVKMPAECEEKDYKEFYKVLYPFEEEPLFWMHLNVDYPFHLKGILYFPRIKKDFDFSKSTVSLYSNRVFVSQDCKDILPEYLSMLKGVIDSPDIPLNVSRSYLQVDRTVKNLAGHISKKVVDALTSLYKNDRTRFYSVWPDVEAICKLAILHEDKAFSKAKEFLIWKTIKGDWTTIDSYLEKNKEKSNNTIYYAHQDAGSELLKLFEEKGLDVIVSTMPLDAPLFASLEKDLNGARFMRIDAALDHLIDPAKEKTLLDADGKTEGSKIQSFVKNALSDITVEAKSLASPSLPAFLSFKEDERRLRDYLKRIAPEGMPHAKDTATFVVNTNNPLVTSLYSLHQTEPNLAQMMVKQLYHLAKLSQQEFDPAQSKAFVTESFGLLEKVSSKLTNNQTIIV